MRILMTCLLVLIATPSLARAAEPSVDAVLVQRFIDGASGPCKTAPAEVCVDAGWWFAASDPDRGLSVYDVTVLRQRLGAWFEHYQGDMRPQARASFGLGLMIADGITMPGLHAAFDSDGDGWVTRQELLADVTLDERPLGEVLSDPEAVDRASLAQRLRLPPVLIEGLFQ